MYGISSNKDISIKFFSESVVYIIHVHIGEDLKHVRLSTVHYILIILQNQNLTKHTGIAQVRDEGENLLLHYYITTSRIDR